VLACYVVNTSTEDDSGKHKCKLVLDDYYECLHHRKEVRLEPCGKDARVDAFAGGLTEAAIQYTKTLALQNAYRKREAQTSRDQAPSAGEIRSLGLLDRKDEEVNVKHGNLLPTFSSNVPKGRESIVEKVTVG
jgi:NADH dehydrogenase (ubiquinone) Fe-S protein 5